MSRKRVVIAGLGDSGVLTAIKLARHADVVGISAKPALVTGQELGLRISRPNDWARDNWISFDRFRGLDRVRTVHGTLTGVDLAARIVFVQRDDGSPLTEPYDALIISTGVTNGFWRRSTLQSADEIATDLQAAHDRLAATESVIVVGGGAAAVSSAANLAITWPDKRVDLYFPGDRGLPRHHPRTWARIRQRLIEVGVELHPGHRALLPDGFTGDEITNEPAEASRSGPQTLIRAGGTLDHGASGRPRRGRPTGLAVDFVVESDHVQLSEIVQRVQNDDCGRASATLRDPRRCHRRPQSDRATQREDDHPHSSIRTRRPQRPPLRRNGFVSDTNPNSSFQRGRLSAGTPKRPAFTASRMHFVGQFSNPTKALERALRPVHAAVAHAFADRDHQLRGVTNRGAGGGGAWRIAARSVMLRFFGRVTKA